MSVKQMFINRKDQWASFVKDNPRLGLTEEPTDLNFLQRFVDITIHDAGGFVPFECFGIIQGLPFYYRERHGYAQLQVAARYETETRIVPDVSGLFDENGKEREEGVDWTLPIPRKAIEEVKYPFLKEDTGLVATAQVKEFREDWGWLETFLQLVDQLELNVLYAWSFVYDPDAPMQTGYGNEALFHANSSEEARQQMQAWQEKSQRIIFDDSYNRIITPEGISPIQLTEIDEFRDDTGVIRFSYAKLESTS